ncbi:MoxR family ATPase [Caballeronia sp. dw_19]|uniref:AAA family ATPase n=1 Tax=Caballeronia sp. dw_19 TaxID=2719791 RepID=UPI001BD1E660|nr:MoxR family ATPase [Caballeronia sp. dw_19]
MDDWRLSKDNSGSRVDRWRSLPRPAVGDITGPEGYLADDALIDAINTSIYLGMPLLLTGAPGCGKSEVGAFVAWKLGLKEAIRLDVKSTTTARDLFYRFDTLARFHAASEKGSNIDPHRFITFHGLGTAILLANEPEAVADLIAPEEHPEKRRSVVLIDEIDKAPRDVPNDLLVEVENMKFYIAELNRTVTAEKKMRPAVVITSNSERSLPDAFLRRCVYFELKFPSEVNLRKIIASRVTGLAATSSLVVDSVHLYQYLHRQSLRKKPGTAELLAFVLVAQERGITDLRSPTGWHPLARLTLLKGSDDQHVDFDQIQWAQAGQGD